MREQCVDAFAAAVHEIEHAFGQACFFQQFDDQDGSERNFFAWLEHERVSAGERVGKHPHRHHGRKIKRRDPNAHAEGLMHCLAIDAAREVFEHVAHQQRRDTAGVLDVFDAAVNAAARFRQRLAVFARDGFANAIEVFFDQLAITKEQARAFHRRRVAPRWKRVGRRLHGKIDMFLSAHRHFGDDFAAGRIENRRHLDIRDFAPVAADENGDGIHKPQVSNPKTQGNFKLQLPICELHRNFIVALIYGKWSRR